MAAVWLAVWVSGVAWSDKAMSDVGRPLSEGLARSGLALAVAAAILLTVCGYLVCRPRRGIYLWALVAYVWVLLLALYVVAMVDTATAGSDDAAGAGLVILGIPMLIVVATLACLGAGARLLVRHLIRGRPLRQ